MKVLLNVTKIWFLILHHFIYSTFRKVVGFVPADFWKMSPFMDILTSTYFCKNISVGASKFRLLAPYTQNRMLQIKNIYCGLGRHLKKSSREQNIWERSSDFFSSSSFLLLFSSCESFSFNFSPQSNNLFARKHLILNNWPNVNKKIYKMFKLLCYGHGWVKHKNLNFYGIKLLAYNYWMALDMLRNLLNNICLVWYWMVQAYLQWFPMIKDVFNLLFLKK